MNTADSRNKIEELETKIANLPQGSISKKTINGKVYYYHRITIDKTRKENYISFEEYEVLKPQIDERKELEAELKSLKRLMPKSKRTKTDEVFETNVIIGNRLKSFISSVKKYKRRECYNKLKDFVYSDNQNKVFILYGLRRTGKTTMIRQVLAQMKDSDLSKAAFIQITYTDTLAKVNKDMKKLQEGGYKYVFIDEVTAMVDFIEGAALFSDIFAPCGMNIVLSGTDSLGFVFTEDSQLYDRCIFLHTTFIPYREFEKVIGIRGIDEYIEYGGTMSISGVDYNKTSTFANKKNADEYVDTAIAKNIQHSLKCYKDGGNFRHLEELFSKRELTNIINRVVEDINHRFTLDVLTRDFKSNDLALSARNLRHDSLNPTDALDLVDSESIAERLKQKLTILNQDEQTVKIKDIHRNEIKEYLKLLDMICDIDIEYLPDVSQKSSRTVISQPGLRYAQAGALIESLMLDATFANLTLTERNRIQDRILNEIKGRMMEDIVLLESKLANPEKQVFNLQFAVGEFDMVIADSKAETCKIFEIKHSQEIVKNQYRHLVDEEKCRITENRFGRITEKVVIYRGENQTIDGIRYWNVEDYLNSLS